MAARLQTLVSRVNEFWFAGIDAAATAESLRPLMGKWFGGGPALDKVRMR